MRYTHTQVDNDHICMFPRNNLDVVSVIISFIYSFGRMFYNKYPFF